jgi:hypothetical protein
MEQLTIRVERGAEIRPEVFAYKVVVGEVEIRGQSRQPLLEACRQIKPLLGKPLESASAVTAAIYREGKDEPDLTCSVEWGAAHYVFEDDAGIRFRQRQTDEEVAALHARLGHAKGA